MCIEILKHKPRKIFALEISEINLFNLLNKIKEKKYNLKNVKPILGDASDDYFLKNYFKEKKIDEIYHAAAYKHVSFGQENPYSIVLKSRQLGLSTLSAGYSLWLMLFHKDKNILCIATKQETARNMVTKVKFMYDNLPSWLKIPADENNKLSLRLSNGSIIKATSASSDAGR